jgi:E3 ubiquitin-protein ligase MYCBP2
MVMLCYTNFYFYFSVLLPTQTDHASSFKCLAINKRDGNCSSFSGVDQVDFSNTATCLDPLYNVLWR